MIVTPLCRQNVVDEVSDVSEPLGCVGQLTDGRRRRHQLQSFRRCRRRRCRRAVQNGVADRQTHCRGIGGQTVRRTDGRTVGYNVVRTAHYSASTFRRAKCGGRVLSTLADVRLTRYYGNRCQTVWWTDRQTASYQILCTLISYE